MPAVIVQTEKAYNLQKDNVYVLTLTDGQELNKIQLAQLLEKNKLHPLKITTVSPVSKMKTRGQRRQKIAIGRAKKYYIKLKAGEQLTEETKLEF
jgi:ribosomal protein L23